MSKTVNASIAAALGFTCLAASAPASAGMAEAEAAIAQRDYTAAYRELRPLADQRNAKAQRLIGGFYLFGLAREKNAVQANEWFRRAAGNGDRSAKFLLGQSYKLGRGVDRNEKMAFGWFLKAAEANHRASQGEVAMRYNFGRGTGRDLDAAIRWYRSAADAGHVLSIMALAEMHLFGNARIRQDARKAIVLYQRAAGLGKKGSARALERLGRIHEEGISVQTDPVSAYAYYKLSLNAYLSDGERLARKRNRLAASSFPTAAMDRVIAQNRSSLDNLRTAETRLRNRLSAGQLDDAKRRAADWSGLISN